MFTLRQHICKAAQSQSTYSLRVRCRAKIRVSRLSQEIEAQANIYFDFVTDINLLTFSFLCSIPDIICNYPFSFEEFEFMLNFFLIHYD